MTRGRQVRLAQSLDAFIEDQVASGKYADEAAVIEEALRLLERHEARLEALRHALIEGEQSGEALPFDMETWLAEKSRLDAAA